MHQTKIQRISASPHSTPAGESTNKTLPRMRIRGVGPRRPVAIAMERGMMANLFAELICKTVCRIGPENSL